jgi:hypothetical protein
MRGWIRIVSSSLHRLSRNAVFRSGSISGTFLLAPIDREGVDYPRRVYAEDFGGAGNVSIGDFLGAVFLTALAIWRVAPEWLR